ncbi:hypothetical protein CLOM_g6256 [Closterium sp. NIES-68]|nr:hypothetical protein CLOM_g6256 [Closterium sp. NIES-68]
MFPRPSSPAASSQCRVPLSSLSRVPLHWLKRQQQPGRFRRPRRVSVEAADDRASKFPVEPSSRDSTHASSEEGIVMELPCLPFNPAEVFLPGSSKTLHLYEARYLALLEEVLSRSHGLLGHVVLEPMRADDGQA